jgi:hypothetical protein
MPIEIRELVIKTEIRSAPKDADNVSQGELSKLKKGILQNCLAMLKRAKNKFKR